VREHGHHALRVLRRELEATRQKFTELLARLPVDPTAGQPTYAEAISGTLHALYLAANWKLQAIDLQKLWEQGPAAVPPTGRPRREQEMAIACGEVPSPPASAFPAIDAVAQQRSGVAGPSWAWDYEPCSTWPVRSANRYTGPWDHRTANQVLVIANTFDPATPVRGAVAIAEAWSGAPAHGGRLQPHGVDQSERLREPIRGRYFVSEVLPPKGTRCAQDGDPFDD